jgi:hypothetical protein
MSFQGLRSGIRQRGPRLAKRHPNGESDGILDSLTPMVRPELRRKDLTGIPEISDPQERVDVEHLGGMSPSWGPTVLGVPVPREESELRPSTRISRK